MKKYLYDVEIYPNYFSVGFKELNKDNILHFELSEYRDNIKELGKFLKTKHILIGFNSINYDNVIINCALCYSGQENYTQYIKSISDEIVNDNFDRYKKYKKKRFKSVDIDLFLFWSKKLRISKKLSLKGLAVQLNMPIIEELPYPNRESLTEQQIEKVRNYNIHDLEYTEALCNALEDDIKLRFNLYQERGFYCFSWDTIKIANEELAKSYSEITGMSLRDIKNQSFEKDMIKIGDLLEDLNIQFKTDTLKNFYKYLCNQVNKFNKKVLFVCNETRILLSFAIGGLHSKNINEKYFTDDKYQLLTSDIASMYPTNIINYKLIRFRKVLDRYVEIKKIRFKAKAKQLEKNNNLYNKFYKLVLNGVSGLLDNVYSWLYYPEGALKLRIMGQLILTKLIEEASLNNFNVISANTDGKLKCPSI